MDIYVSETEHFTVKLRDIFSNYIYIFKNEGSIHAWSKGPDMKYWDQQLNFAIWVATTGCGVSHNDHLYNESIPKQIRSFLRFHVYFTCR